MNKLPAIESGRTRIQRNPGGRVYIHTLSLGVALLVTCTGCQTFKLTDEQWQAQKEGKTVDPGPSTVMEALGVPLQIFGPCLNK